MKKTDMLRLRPMKERREGLVQHVWNKMNYKRRQVSFTGEIKWRKY